MRSHLPDHASRLASLAVSAVGLVCLLATQARAQGRAAPPDAEDPILTGRTATPSQPTATGRTPAAPLHAPQPETDDKAGLLEWPWRGTIRSPEWTQDRSFFPGTRFWLMDAGRVELDATYDVSMTHRHGQKLTHYIGAEANVGLVPHLSLGVTENTFLPPSGGFQQEGNRIEVRFAPFDYGVFPLNPTAMFVWNPRHGDGEDRLEARLLAGGELFTDFFIVGNGFYTQETGGQKNGTWGFTAAAGYELVRRAVRLGGEVRMEWDFQIGRSQPFHTYILEAGPSFAIRPFAMMKEEWGRHLKIQGTCFFGVNQRAPLVEGVGVVGFEF